ncbi:hypothetical protein CR513_20762, partial [Mucuna pruriens]
MKKMTPILKLHKNKWYIMLMMRLKCCWQGIYMIREKLEKILHLKFLTLVQVLMPPKAKRLKYIASQGHPLRMESSQTFVPLMTPNQQPHIPPIALNQQPHISLMSPTQQPHIPPIDPTQQPHIPPKTPIQQPHILPKAPI